MMGVPGWVWDPDLSEEELLKRWNKDLRIRGIVFVVASCIGFIAIPFIGFLK